MDQDVSKWIIEFLLRQKLDEKLINYLLESLPLKHQVDNQLKKTLLLKKIEFETSKPLISEKILGFLEIIEEIDYRGGKPASNSMRNAYCNVAVDCAVRFLDESGGNTTNFEAVKNVWIDRVSKIEGLASNEFKWRLGRIEASVWDSATHVNLLKVYTKNEALKSVRVYLDESRRSLGPTFLDLVAKKAGNALEELIAGCSDPPVGPESCFEFQADGETPKAKATFKEVNIAANEGNREESTEEENAIGDVMINDKCRNGSAKISVGDGRNDDLIAPTTPMENTENHAENAEKKNPIGDPMLGEARLNCKSNLMEPKQTAHTYERDDSDEKLSKRPRLPSPNESKPSSPLNTYECTKITRRRMRRNWTPLEVDTLRAGVKKFGKGNWKFILDCNPGIFKDRTDVDLKDKWRNMIRT